MSEDNQNTPNLDLPEVDTSSAETTEKIPPVSEEVLANFAPKKKEKDESIKKDEVNNDESIDVEEESTWAEVEQKDTEENLENSESSVKADNEDDASEAEGTSKTVVDFSEDFDIASKEEALKNDKPQKFLHPFRIIVGAIIIFLSLMLIFGIWNRWFRYNDQQEFISNWVISGTDKTVVIDKECINLNPNAVLKYKVDSFAKVINYEIGDMKGCSHYRFSWDRAQLAIVENCATDPISTIASDLGWFWDWATCGMSKIDLSPAYTKNNKQEVNTQNTGLDDIMNNGSGQSILLDKIPTKKPETSE